MSALTETLFRTRDALVQQQEAANRLSDRIRKLTVWICWFTVAMALIAAAQIGGWIYAITHRG